MTRSPAPIALFVYRRAQHTQATLAALSKNLLAGESDLYVFCDGPKSPAEKGSVAKVRDIVRRARGFKSVTLIEHAANKGLANSVISGVSQMLESFDRLIVLEDDLLTSRHFLLFMNMVLDRYSDDQNIFSVTGHTFPDAVLKIPEEYEWDTYAGYRCSSWSWGTWRDRWKKIDWKMEYFPRFARDIESQAAFNRGGEDLTPMLSMQYEHKIDSWAIRFAFAHYVNNGCCIYPIRTLVRNIGLDASGTHTRLDQRFIHDYLAEDWLPSKFCPTDSMDSLITKRFRAIFDVPAIPFALRVKRKIFRLTGVAHEFIARGLDWLLRSRVEGAGDVDILFVNTYQSSGGAARAAFRCFTGIRKYYPRVDYLSLHSDLSESYLRGLKRSSLVGRIALRLAFLDRLQLLLYPHRQQTIFSPAFWANPCRMRLPDYSPRLVHLHWVTSGVIDLKDFSELDVPFVWTLHDQWPFTGGCHYADGCNRYKQQCGRCPILGSEAEADISRGLWLRKLDAYSKANLTIVAPSRWMADLATQSSLFANKRIEVIPNGLDTDIFSPLDRFECRSQMGIPSERPVLLFGAHLVSDERKGGDLLAAALSQIGFSCVLLVFGEGSIDAGGNLNVTVHRLGSIEDDGAMARMYCAADVFICPSRIDNLPNTLAEAMACGVPCVAFDVGGIPEMIDHKKNGWLATPFDPNELSAGIEWIIHHPEHEVLRANAREKALAEYSLPVMSKRYRKLYEELLDSEQT